MNIYVASSWRNRYQPGVVEELRKLGHEVYDFKCPPEGSAFSWKQILPLTDSKWTGEELREALQHPFAKRAFAADRNALLACDLCLLVLPCGNSAHLELGWVTGKRRPCLVYIPSGELVEPELMYKLCLWYEDGGRGDMVDPLCTSMQEVITKLREVHP